MRRIAGNRRVGRNILRDHRTRSDYSARTNSHTTHDKRTRAYPGIVLDPDRPVVQVQLCRMSPGENGLNLFVPLLGIYRMSQVVEHVDRVRYQDPVTDYHGRPRPYPRTLSDVAPGSDLNLSAVSKRRKLTPYDAVGTDCNAIAFAPNVANSGGSQQARAGAETASRPPK